MKKSVTNYCYIGNYIRNILVTYIKIIIEVNRRYDLRFSL